MHHSGANLAYSQGINTQSGISMPAELVKHLWMGIFMFLRVNPKIG